jgi:DNA-3-methyladenine glycosylase II
VRRPRPDGRLPQTLTPELLAQAVRILGRRDRDLGRLVRRFGPPPMWGRRPGFASLVHIILEQQVSLASARAAFTRLRAAIAPVTPRRLLALDDTQLKTIGFSRQKTVYARHLARALIDGQLRLADLPGLPDESVRITLTQLKGVGDWTAAIYLLMCLRRPDVWPNGDLALVAAAQKAKGLPIRPGPEDLADMAEGWRPWRSVAARILWHAYLSEKRLERHRGIP